MVDDVPIHDFRVENGLMFTLCNDFRKGDDNKSIIKVYELKEEGPIRLGKRSFKNV